MRSIKQAGLLLVLFLLITSISFAQAQIGFKGVGGALGYVKPENVDATIGFGAVVDLGTVSQNLGLEADVDYWSKSEKAGGFESSFRDLSIVGVVKYLFALENSQIKPYALGGLGFHFFKSKVEVPDIFGVGLGGTFEDSETKIGIDIGGGAAYGVNEKVDVFAEARYRLVSDINQFLVKVGAIFKLGK